LAQQGIVKTIKLNASPGVPTVGQVLTVTGWGDTTEGGIISNTLQKVDVNYVSQDTCVAIYGANSAEMCTGVTGGGKDSC
jgi:trypsin